MALPPRRLRWWQHSALLCSSRSASPALRCHHTLHAAQSPPGVNRRLTDCVCVLCAWGQVGSQAKPVTNVALHDLTVAHADITYLLPYETPSGGGFSVYRGGAIHIEGAQNPRITEVTVDSPGGNGLLLSNYVRGAVIARSEFKWVGDSAIVMLGSTIDTQPCNGTNGDQPRGTQIVGCFIHEVGVWGKQGAGIFQALTSDTNISHTVIFVSAADSSRLTG